MYGLPKWQLDKIQRVQNAAARIVSRTKKHDHITPVFLDLHWLPVPARINYKILLLTYKALHGKAPLYLKDLLIPDVKSRVLHSKDKDLLVCPKSSSVRYGDRAFAHAAPTLWNSLPTDIKKCVTVDSFKAKLKTYLFQQAYDL